MITNFLWKQTSSGYAPVEKKSDNQMFELHSDR